MNPFPLLAVLAVGAAALHRGSPTPEVATHARDTNLQVELKAEAQDEGEVLPNPKRFALLWTDLTKNITGHVEVFPDIKLVLGVFTTVKEVAYRQVIRDTWMHQTGVCNNASLGPRPECSVYTIFVQAGFRDDPHDETLALAMPENMNAGKSFRYFWRALGDFPWATHYGKMDTDVFPYLSVILHSIQQVPSGCQAFLGKPWSCRHGEYCPSSECGPPQDGNFSNYASHNSACWSYMQGGLYILSRRLVRRVTIPGGYGELHQYGPEDVVMGAAVSQVMKERHMCVGTWSRETAMPNVAYFHARKGSPCAVNKTWCDYYGIPPSKATT